MIWELPGHSVESTREHQPDEWSGGAGLADAFASHVHLPSVDDDLPNMGSPGDCNARRCSRSQKRLKLPISKSFTSP